ncbi:MAG TPA: hypothetical protein DDY98_02230 [Ruminococcaceae bacterium]|nr:hypothetical protein [Oscillospiraceae bacterium]
MAAKMTYAEYEKAVLEDFKTMKGFPEEYIKDVQARGCIRRSYDESVRVSDLLGSNQLSPSGFVYGCHMLYPDFPDGDEAEPEKPVFDFKFNPVHKNK